VSGVLPPRQRSSSSLNFKISVRTLFSVIGFNIILIHEYIDSLFPVIVVKIFDFFELSLFCRGLGLQQTLAYRVNLTGFVDPIYIVATNIARGSAMEYFLAYVVVHGSYQTLDRETAAACHSCLLYE